MSKIAVVTGASRGIGKGIALELGAIGMTVYVTGRSVDGGMLPGTVGETAAQIDELGGRGVALAVDHHDDAQVEAAVRRVLDEHGTIDVLVNNVFSAPDLAAWLGKPFWELPVKAWDEVIDIGCRSHYVASAFAAPSMVAAKGGLIVNVTSDGAVQYAHNVPYGVGKAAVDKMTADMAHELKPHGVAAISVWPGLVKTELVMFGAQTRDDGSQYLDLGGEGAFELGDAESPRFVGRGVAALASDPEVLVKTGRAIRVADLADEYGFTDIDGSVPRLLIRNG
ncbi:MAG: dehydrogenase/reductase family er 1 [Frankiales bacterium]|jgi:NAD(P)-dependent dehydrogenase (short-subunit alcohol dehydrogenase family)|nr:dehydrogenase/reductase family er 1 [Frankiales bacterium]MDX6267293.1 dehydrogenase/reductase family er 1 [Frankiales bacterium]